LTEDLPKIVDQRVPYLDVTFEALIKCQLKFAEEAYRKLEHIRLQIADCKDMQLSAEVESALQHMRDLSIVSIGNPTGNATSPTNKQ
jgi:amphiphysin